MKLYKYLASDRIDVLFDRNIRFTQPADLNDPFEVKPYLKGLLPADELEKVVSGVIRQEAEKAYSQMPSSVKVGLNFNTLYQHYQSEFRSKKNMYDDVISRMVEHVRLKTDEDFSVNLGILSITESRDNLLMWSHYAVSHTGYVLGFNKNLLTKHFETSNQMFLGLHQVEYRDERPKMNISEMSGADWLLVKSNDWEYEKEWRLLRPVSESDICLEQSPHDIHLFSFPAELIEEVVLGHRMLSEHKERIIEHIQSRAEYSHIEIFDAVPDERVYCLNFRKVC